jgi:hypothetical protein
MKSLGAGVFVLAASVVLAAQSTAVDVTIARGSCRASVRAAKTEPYAGGPWAAIRASCMNDSPQTTAQDFRIRVWKLAQRESLCSPSCPTPQPPIRSTNHKSRRF